MTPERKMPARPLNFDPGKPAVTPMSDGLDGSAPADIAATKISAPKTSGSAGSAAALKGVLVYLAPAEAIALKVYGAQHSISIQQLGTEAFADLFKKRGINGGVLTRVRANRKNGGNR